MKKLVVSLVMFVSVFSAAIASDGGKERNKINYRVEAAFQREFSGAKSVKWDMVKNENIYQAQFIYNNERLNAYFDADGNLIATGRFVSAANLPLLIRKNIRQKYDEYKISEVVEYTTGDQTSYLVMVENEKARMLIQGYVNGSLNVFKKEKKNSLAKL